MQEDTELEQLVKEEPEEVVGLEAEADVEVDVVPEEPTPIVEDDRHWYVVHCYSGYENKVRHNLEQRIETMGMKNKIFDVVVPTEEEIEVKDGKRRTVERRVFPGYILVQMIMGDDSWAVVRNTPGVTGFVQSGEKPSALSPDEVKEILERMEEDTPRIKVSFRPGQAVLIVDDLLATGGTAAASIRLVEQQGARIVGLAFLIELSFLGGRQKLGDYFPNIRFTASMPSIRASTSSSVL